MTGYAVIRQMSAGLCRKTGGTAENVKLRPNRDGAFIIFRKEV